MSDSPVFMWEPRSVFSHGTTLGGIKTSTAISSLGAWNLTLTLQYLSLEGSCQTIAGATSSPRSQSPVRGQGSAKTRCNQCVISHITKMRPSALSWMTRPRHLRRRTARRRNRALWPPRFRQKMLSSLPSSIPEM
jgi:hypothetical protein